MVFLQVKSAAVPTVPISDIIDAVRQNPDISYNEALRRIIQKHAEEGHKRISLPYLQGKSDIEEKEDKIVAKSEEVECDEKTLTEDAIEDDKKPAGNQCTGCTNISGIAYV